MRCKTSRILPWAVSLLVLTCLPAVVGSAPALGAALPEAPATAAGQIIVTWRAGASAADRAAVLAAVHPRGHRPVSAGSAGADLDLVDLPGGVDAAQAAHRLAEDARVASAEPNRLLHRAGDVPLSSLFNDPLLVDGTQWHLLGSGTTPGNPYGANAVGAWRAGTTGSPDVYVGVVDEGVNFSHPDLAGNVFNNPWEKVNGRDDDHNGYVDDVHGWDFVNNDATVYDGANTTALIDAHGTATAGEIAEVQGNGIGGSGAAPGVKVIPAKFLGPGTGTTAGAIAALDYLTDLKTRHGLNVVATSNSWEGAPDSPAESVALQAAIQRGADAGILFVTIAGNGDDKGKAYDIDVVPNYPASMTCTLPTGGDCMVVATALNSKGAMGNFANFGARTVDLGAPGVSVTSLFVDSGYTAFTGTSMAGPLVAAAVALYRSKYPTATPTATRNAILASVVPTKSLAGTTATGGRLDIAAALARH